jgi:hypothetical protein
MATLHIDRLAKLTLAVAVVSLSIATPAFAQVTINSTGVVSGTVIPPNKNPTFNQSTTRVDTDAQGRYFRNGQLVFSAQDINPRLVGVRPDGTFYVDFRGIPIVSVDGALTSTSLSGQLDAVKRFNSDAPVKFWGNIQDELVVQGNFTGTAYDPATNNQYQGTFAIKGQGPRYSDANAAKGPTVFDFKSYYNTNVNPKISGTPTVPSYSFPALPVKLTITVPTGLVPTGTGALAPIVNSPIVNSPIGNIPIVNSPVSPIGLLTASTELSVIAFPALSGAELNHVLLRPRSRQIGPRSRVLFN